MAEILHNIRNSYTFRLRKNPLTFIEGVAAVLDLSGEIVEKYNTDATDNEADFHSLSADWKAVGKDMRIALERYTRNK